MRATTKLVTAFLLAVAPAVAAAGPARAGGGCHTGVTQGEGSTIQIVDACFTPTILHVRPGQSVTWINRDPFVHNVTANDWGHFDDLLPGDRFTTTFDEGGLYPFACTYHPGMSGVIVVGAGAGPGNGTTVDTAEPIDQPAPAQVATSASATGSGGWAAPAAAALVLGVLAGLGISAIRRRTAAV